MATSIGLQKNRRWQRITLTRQEYESGELAVLMGAFRAAYVARNGPEGMAMFGCRADDGAGYLVFTTPESERHIAPILHAYSAHPADKPDAVSLSLIYGDESGLSAFGGSMEA